MEGNENGYTYKGHTFASERDMLRYLLDDYRCAEGFAAQYLGNWQAIAAEPRTGAYHRLRPAGLTMSGPP